MLYSLAKSFVYWSLSQACITINNASDTCIPCSSALGYKTNFAIISGIRSCSATQSIRDDSVGCAKSITPARSNQVLFHCQYLLSELFCYFRTLQLLLQSLSQQYKSSFSFESEQLLCYWFSLGFNLVMLFWDHLLLAHQLYYAISAAASNLWLDSDWLLHPPRV